jgi:hypothetical protein
MVWYKIDSGTGRLWLTLLAGLELLFNWLERGRNKSNPSPLKSLSATQKGTST